MALWLKRLNEEKDFFITSSIKYYLYLVNIISTLNNVWTQESMVRTLSFILSLILVFKDEILYNSKFSTIPNHKFYICCSNDLYVLFTVFCLLQCFLTYIWYTVYLTLWNLTKLKWKPSMFDNFLKGVIIFLNLTRLWEYYKRLNFK